MQTASSAKRTWRARASASECTATVATPSSRHARITRSAISPRFAMRIFLNGGVDGGAAKRMDPGGFEPMSGLLDAEQLLTELDALSVLRVDLDDGAADLGLDLVHQLHRFDDAERLPGADDGADVDEGRRVRRGRAIERADE